MNEVLLCTFQVGAALYAVDVLRVREIGRPAAMTPVAGAPFTGMALHRGEAVPVIDLRQKLGVPASAPGQLLFVEVSRNVAGLLVDRVQGVVRAPLSSVRPMPAGGPAPFAGSLPHQGEVVLLLDVKAMLAPAAPEPPRKKRRRGKAA